MEGSKITDKDLFKEESNLMDSDKLKIKKDLKRVTSKLDALKSKRNFKRRPNAAEI